MSAGSSKKRFRGFLRRISKPQADLGVGDVDEHSSEKLELAGVIFLIVFAAALIGCLFFLLRHQLADFFEKMQA